MAYALQFDGSNDYVTLDSQVGGAYANRLDTSEDWSIEFEFARKGADSYVHRILDDTTRGSNLIFRMSDGLFRLSGIAGSANWDIPPEIRPAVDVLAHYRIERIVGTKNYEFFLNGVSRGVSTGVVTIFNFDIVGRASSTGYINGLLYSLKYKDISGGGSGDYEMGFTGSGDETSDLTGNGNIGTLVNFPTDDSQWVYYDDGGATFNPLWATHINQLIQ